MLTHFPNVHTPEKIFSGKRLANNLTADRRRLLGSVFFMLPEMSIKIRISFTGGGVLVDVVLFFAIASDIEILKQMAQINTLPRMLLL